MEASINEEILNLMNVYKVGGGERNKIDAICNDLVCNNALMGDIQNALHPLIDKKDFNIAKNIPSLITAILSVIKHIEYYKVVNEERMRYVLYCILLSALLKYYPSVLKTIELEHLRNAYKECIDLVLLIPETIKVSKKSCLTCIGQSVKIFKFLNKNKVIVE
jgi:hypothetical protein